MELAVALADRLEVGGVELGGGDLAALDEADRVLRGQSQRVDHRVLLAGDGSRRAEPGSADA